MVGKVIRDYMETGAKKLTVPGFGTFMRKDTGNVIFVDLLRKDDGKLRELVEDYGHYSEVEAMAMVDRFIFETKTAIERNGSAAIDGFGTILSDDKGLYRFDYSPKAKPVKEHPVQERLFGPEEQRTGSEESHTAAVKPHVATAKSASAADKNTTTRSETSVSERERPQQIKRTNHGTRPAPNRTAQARRIKKSRNLQPSALILIAIIAATIAIIVMVYGLSTGNMPFIKPVR